MTPSIPSAARAGLWVLAAAGALAAAMISGEPSMASPAAAQAATVASTSAASADAPVGFVYGTDSTSMAIPGRGPYTTPVVGGTYDGYIGMVGNWAHWQKCAGSGKVVWSSTDAADARADLETYHSGIGTGAYWFMAGPGVDPHYSGTYAEALKWGEEQGAAALAAIRAQSPRINYQIVFEDVEIPGNAPTFTPAPDNGWNTVYTAPCSGRVRSHGISAHVDRGVVNGFAAYITASSAYKIGVYSAPGIWRSIFGTGTDSLIPTTYEWTYTADTNSLSHPPYGWHLAGIPSVAAQFFGGQSSNSKYAVMWQWTGGGGTHNGYGDFDQIDVSRSP